MDDSRATKRTPSYEALSTNFVGRPRFGLERDATRPQSAPRATSENRAPRPLPTALNSMLKNTTETGDIGLFSIQPRYPAASSRLKSPHKSGILPRNHHLQGSQQNGSSHNGLPIVDDRRCLPSYTRDATSEIASLYETASLTSGVSSRVFEEPEYRSYSMTQTSYSSYTLSNHRSYASLRSQPELGLIQRPRSPFPYPARLKRPGVRPSSPVLATGGIVDYSRRAKIERTPLDGIKHPSSPASLYAQKRLPAPLSLRSEANRSVSSSLGAAASSSKRTCPSGSVTSDSNNCSNRHEQFQRRQSPARSTLSSTSSVIHNQGIASTSTTSTPGRFHPPSPLYYDYTEDFDIEDEHGNEESKESLPCPPCFMEKVIPEDGVLSADYSSLDVKSPLNPQIPRSQSFEAESAVGRIAKSYDRLVDPISLRWGLQEDLEQSTVRTVQGDYCTGRDSNKNRGITDIDTSKPAVLRGSSEGQERSISSLQYRILGHDDLAERDSISKNSSCYSISTHLPVFPRPLDRLVRIQNVAPQAPRSEKELIIQSENTNQTPHYVNSDIQPLPLRASSTESEEVEELYSRAPPQHSISNQESTPNQLGNLYTINSGFSELTQLFANFDVVRKPFSSEDLAVSSPVNFSTARRIRTDSPILPGETLKCVHPNSRSKGMLGRYHSEGDLRPSNNKVERLRSYPISPSMHEFRLNQRPTAEPESRISSNVLCVPTSRLESPMLAPTAVSPARVLRLKNSVPQLMKALPPLPSLPDPSSREFGKALCPSEVSTLATFLPFRSSPLYQMSEQDQTIVAPTLSPSGSPELLFHNVELDLVPIQLDSIPTRKVGLDFPTPLSSSFPKLKLKSRSSDALRPLSPPDSRPWNQEESYTWAEIDPNVRFPSFGLSKKPVTPKAPKFRLKVTRASTSTFGTIKVSKGANRCKAIDGIDLRNPKDLFTPSSGLSNVFRQVSHRFGSRKSSSESEQRSSRQAREQRRPTPLTQSSRDRGVSLDLGIPSRPIGDLPYLGSPTDARSFFSDDSSHVQGRVGLRKRFSDLRARLPMSHALRSQATQSCDDFVWRDRTSRPLYSAARSPFNKKEARSSVQMRMGNTNLTSRRLRLKVSEWLRGTKTAIKVYIKKSRHSDQVQLYPGV